LCLGIFMLFSSFSFAQDLEPRRWTPLPLSTQIFGIGYGHTHGTIHFDPLLNIRDASVTVNSFVLQYLRPFKIGKKLARFDVLIPFSIAHWEGYLNDTYTTVNRNGFADPRLRVSINFIGPDAMNPKEFQNCLSEHKVFTVVGASLAVTLPLGQYFNEKILNLGQNQFVFRPQIGFVHHWKSWSYELTGSVFIYNKNENFSDGNSKKQNATFATQTHLTKRFKNKTWASLSAGYGLVGQSIVNKQPNHDDRADFLAAASLGFVLAKKQSIKLSYIRTETLKDIGADLNSFILGWSVLF